MALFKHLDGVPIKFYLADLSEEMFKKYKNLIQCNGGKVEVHPHETVLTFTFPSTSYNHRFVFDVKFIEDCVEFKEVLNINQYFIGDSRLTPKCKMTQQIMGIANNCLCCIYGQKNLKVGAINRQKNFSLEEIQESIVKSNPPPSKSKNSALKENEPFVSKPQRKPVILENSSLDSDTMTVVSGTDSDSDSDYQLPSSEIPETEAHEFSTFSEHDSAESENVRVTKRITRSSKTTTSNSPKKTRGDLFKLRKRTQRNSKSTSSTLKSNPSISESKHSDTEKESESSDENLEASGSKSKPSTRKRRTKSIVTDELLKWAEEVNKTVKVDVFGHPIGEDINFQPWEQRRMIDFIIKSGNIYNASLFSTWACAEDLKILPKHRTKKAMRSNMVSIILPKIEEFRLRPEILSEFVNLRSDLAMAKRQRRRR